MNKYIIPICDIQENIIYNKVIYARSISECQEKLISECQEKLVEDTDYIEYSNYNDFIEKLNDRDILIGAITDIEEL